MLEVEHRASILPLRTTSGPQEKVLIQRPSCEEKATVDRRRDIGGDVVLAIIIMSPAWSMS